MENSDSPYPEPQIIISLREYQDLIHATHPLTFQQALGEIVALIMKVEPEGEIAKGVSDLLTFHQIHIKPI